MNACGTLRRHRAASSRSSAPASRSSLALLAADVSAWQTTVARDDLRFRALPAHMSASGAPRRSLPGDPASLLIGTGSTISYRDALQYFWYSRIGSNPEVRQDTPTLRAKAQERVAGPDLARRRPRKQRSAAANLLGVLVVTTPATG